MTPAGSVCFERAPSKGALCVLLVGLLLLSACGPSERGADPVDSTADPEQRALVLSLAVLDTAEDGSPQPLPARLGILQRRDGEWTYRFIEDPDSNVFHKALAYGAAGEAAGLLTLAGTKAMVKLWRPEGGVETLWEADFGGDFSRMRDAEVGDLYGDGPDAIAVGTHDQGVVAALRPDGAGGFEVEELDRQEDTFVHEIELGDLDADGVLEIYASRSAPNRLDGGAQPGDIVRYVPARGEGRVKVGDLRSRHAKEILVEDLDDDGRQELYASVEAVSGGQVTILRYGAETPVDELDIVATLPDRMCRFLTVGDTDGDGEREVVAATREEGLWLLRPRTDDRWERELVDADSGGFEHAAVLADLDGDGRDELYAASDDHDEVRRYVQREEGWGRQVIHRHTDDLGRFTWNITPVPAAALPTDR